MDVKIDVSHHAVQNICDLIFLRFIYSLRSFVQEYQKHVKRKSAFIKQQNIALMFYQNTTHPQYAGNQISSQLLSNHC